MKVCIKINDKETDGLLSKQYPSLEEMVFALVRGGYELEMIRDKVRKVDLQLKQKKGIGDEKDKGS
jgi:hypothetical protein